MISLLLLQQPQQEGYTSFFPQKKYYFQYYKNVTNVKPKGTVRYLKNLPYIFITALSSPLPYTPITAFLPSKGGLPPRGGIIVLIH